MFETIDLVHDETRAVVGQVTVRHIPGGELAAQMKLHPQYNHLKEQYRLRLEAYLGVVPRYSGLNKFRWKSAA